MRRGTVWGQTLWLQVQHLFCCSSCSSSLTPSVGSGPVSTSLLLLSSHYVASDSFATSSTVARLLCLWDFPGKNTGVCFHFLLQGIFPTPGIEPLSPALQADSLFFYKLVFLKKFFFNLAIMGVHCNMWHLVPRPGIKPRPPPAWKHGVLPTEPPGKSLQPVSLPSEPPGKHQTQNQMLETRAGLLESSFLSPSLCFFVFV